MDLWWDAIDGATSILIEVPAPHCPSSSNNNQLQAQTANTL